MNARKGWASSSGHPNSRNEKGKRRKISLCSNILSNFLAVLVIDSLIVWKVDAGNFSGSVFSTTKTFPAHLALAASNCDKTAVEIREKIVLFVLAAPFHFLVIKIRSVVAPLDKCLFTKEQKGVISERRGQELLAKFFSRMIRAVFRTSKFFACFVRIRVEISNVCEGVSPLSEMYDFYPINALLINA